MDAACFTGYDPLLVFDFVDDPAAFCTLLEGCYWVFEEMDPRPDDWLTFLRRELKEFSDNFQFRNCGRFLLRLATLVHQIQGIGLPAGDDFLIDEWRQGIMQDVIEFVDQVVVNMYPRDLERLSRRRFERKRMELDRMLFVFSSSLSLSCRLSDDVLHLPIRLDRYISKLKELNVHRRSRKRRRACKNLNVARDGPLVRSLAKLKGFLCGDQVNPDHFKDIVSRETISRYVLLRPYMCLQPVFDPAKCAFVFHSGFFELTDTQTCFRGFKNYSKVVKPLTKVTQALKLLLTKIVPDGGILDLVRISSAGLHAWRDVHNSCGLFIKSLDDLSLPSLDLSPGVPEDVVDQEGSGVIGTEDDSIDRADETDQGDVENDVGSVIDDDEAGFGQSLPMVLGSTAFQPRKYRLPDGEMAFIESDPYVVDSVVAPSIATRMVSFTRIDGDEDQLLAKFHELSIWSSSFYGFLFPVVLSLGASDRFFRASLGLDDNFCRKLNILSDLHEILTEELSSSRDGLVKFSDVLQLSKYSLSFDEERGILAAFEAGYKLRQRCFRMMNPCFLEMSFYSSMNLRSDLMVSCLGTTYSPLWGGTETIGPSVRLVLQSSGFHLVPASFTRVEDYRNHPCMRTRDRLNQVRGCVVPTVTVVAREVPIADRYKDALSIIANSVHISDALLSSDAEVREREFSKFISRSCEECPRFDFSDVGDSLTVDFNGLKSSGKFCLRCVPLRLRLMSFGGLLPGDLEFVRSGMCDRLGLQNVEVKDYFDDSMRVLFPTFSQVFDRNVEVQRFQKEPAVLRLTAASGLGEDRQIRGNLLQLWSILVKPWGIDDVPLWLRRSSACLLRSLSLLGVLFNSGKKSLSVEELYQRSHLSQFTGVEMTCPSLRSGIDNISGLRQIFSADHPLVSIMASCGWKFPNSIYGRSVIDSFAGKILLFDWL